ncbi:MAG: ABC transporter permease [Pseudonocardiales bacterium]|nr:MAG: ABC transporter permease [Pseudonocardiales bacterium]
MSASGADFQRPISTSLRGRVAAVRVTPARVLLLLAGLIVLVSVVRLATGASDVTSSGTVRAALMTAVPIAMAGLGGLWAERAGVVNIGLEGMLILGTWGGAWAGYQWGPWAGVVAGIVFGALGGLLHAVATVTFGVDHIVSGVAINLLAPGLTRYLAVILFTGKPGGGPTQSPQVGEIATVSVPWLSNWLGTIEQHHWFVASDLAGILGGLCTELSLLTIVAVLLLPLSFFVLWRTAFGLRLRSCGENPTAAESLGVNVYLMKYVALAASGAFAGLGGVFLSEVASSIYREGQTGGRGFIGLAAMIFGNWRPGGLAAGAGLFGYADALQLRQPSAVHALLLFVGLLLLLLAVRNLLRQRWLGAVLGAVAGAGFLLWFALADQVPGQFVNATPYLTTLVVLAVASQRLRMPAADGLPYRRGQGG